MEHGIDRLLEIVKPGMLCAFDFDGTIAPIVDDLAAARIPPPVLRRLAALAEFTPVAVITGRSVEDVSLRLDFFPEFVVGNHGMEGLPGCEQSEEHYRSMCSEWLRKLHNAMKVESIDAAVWIEDKTYSLSIHYRQAQDPSAAEKRLRQLIQATLPDARTVEGEFVFNILPADAPDKGQALSLLRTHAGASAALYVGDDVTDESVFDLPHDDLLTIRIEDYASTAAEFYLPDMQAMLPFLDMLLKRLIEMLHAEAVTRVPAVHEVKPA